MGRQSEGSSGRSKVPETLSAERPLMKSLFEKEAFTVRKIEMLDEDDRETIDYSVNFIIDCDGLGEGHKGHASVTITTDDKRIFDNFIVGQKVSLKFLKPEDMEKDYNIQVQ